MAKDRKQKIVKENPVKQEKSVRLHKQFVSKKILGLIMDDFSLFGSLPFYIIITLAAYFSDKIILFYRLGYCFIISSVVIIVIKKLHYKDRPEKEEFNIFMEKMIASSFPSTHSMWVTILAALISVAYPQAWVMITWGILALLVYVQRYVRKKHFIIDIIGGILIALVEVIFVIFVI